MIDTIGIMYYEIEKIGYVKMGDVNNVAWKYHQKKETKYTEDSNHMIQDATRMVGFSLCYT